MKILFVTDLHGNNNKYDMIFEAAKSHKVDIVINGGDMLPSQGNLFTQHNFINGYLENHFKHFEQSRIYYLCYLGNDDLIIYDELFEQTCGKSTFVQCIAQKKIEIGGYEFSGMNWIVDYPFKLKDRCRIDMRDDVFQWEPVKGLVSTPSGWCVITDWFTFVEGLPTIEDELNSLEYPRDFEKAIYVIHMPPVKLGLDKCTYGAEVGSKAVYDFIQKNQPRLTLHGHIHESPEMTGRWHNKLGKTVCIQPGQLEDRLTYVVIELDTMEMERFVL